MWEAEFLMGFGFDIIIIFCSPALHCFCGEREDCNQNPYHMYFSSG